MQRGAMLAVQEAKALTIEHEPTGHALTQFKPDEAQNVLNQIEVLARYGVNLRDDGKLYELAVRKIETIVDIVDWLDRNVQQPSRPDQHRPRAEGHPVISIAEALITLGYSPTNSGTITRWRKIAKDAQKDTDATIATIVSGWKMRAGMCVKEKAVPGDSRRAAGTGVNAVEMIFRAYTKLDPDQRIELKQRILAFEKSYKDPFLMTGAKG
jgi:hypothetical protein